MTRVLDVLGRVVTRVPALTLALIVVLTALLGGAVSLLQVDTGMDNFAPAGGRADTRAEIEDRFATTTSVQALIDAGPGGNVIEPSILADVERLAEDIERHPDVAPALAPEAIGQPPVVSFALPFSAMSEALGEELSDLDGATFSSAATTLLVDGGDEVTALFSGDLSTDPPQAQAGILVVELDASVDGDDRAIATTAIDELVADAEVGDTRKATLSLLAIERGIEDSLARDLPVLLSVSLLLMIIALAFLFRSVLDVVVGIGGLMASIVWMMGIAALLGPGGVGVIGPFNQITIAVPVILVGLGIDYSVHLTARYREQRRGGDDAARASRIALVTVGVSLVLATLTSVAGFLSNLVTPLPPIRDFGIFAAIGIASAFVILSTAVPAARTLADRRRDRRGTVDRDSGHAPGDGRSAPDQTPDRVPAWARVATAVATRRPGTTLLVSAVVLAVAAVAASGLSTEFEERDFLPEGEPVLATLDRLDARFGGDVSERTFLLVHGDPWDPSLLEAVALVEDRLPGIDDVRTIDGRAERRSPIELRERIVRMGEMARARVADDLASWHDPQRAAAEVDLPDTLDAEAFLDELDEDDRADALPGELEDALTSRLPADRDPLAALAATGDPAELEETVREGLAEQFRDDRPAGLDDAALAELVTRPAGELTLERLDAAGYPLDAGVSADLARLEALEAVGDVDATDGATLLGHLQVLEREAPDDLARVLDADGLLISVGTSANQDGAARLATELATTAAPILDAGGDIDIVSDPLVNAEIIEELSAAQLVAIAISLAAVAFLLAVATYLGARVVGLGLIGIVPSVVGLTLVLGTMWVLGLAFNALTATVASISVGIGVPYGIHLTNRYRENLERRLGPDGAARDALVNTGPALIGSAATTGLAFVVLTLSNSVPVRQFGIISALMIGFALLACLLVQPALLVLWARRRVITGGGRRRQRGREEREPELVASP